MYALKIKSIAGMTAEAIIHPEIANQIGFLSISGTSIPRDQLLTEFGYPVGVGAKTGNTSTQLYEFINAVLKESKSERFFVQIEATPAHQKIFNSADDLPIANKPLIVVFKDKDIISAEYCNKHNAWHTEQGNINVRQIHQWAYAEDFYNQLNLPQFPERSKRPDSSEIFKSLEVLLDALSEASVEVHVRKSDSNGNSLKDIFDEVFGEKSEIFKSNSKH